MFLFIKWHFSVTSDRMYMPGRPVWSSSTTCLNHSLDDLILKPDLRRILLQELLHTLYVLDEMLVDKGKQYLEIHHDTQKSGLYADVKKYITDSPTIRPFSVAAFYVQSVLNEPNFLREFFLVLMILTQFENLHLIVRSYTHPLLYNHYFQCTDYLMYERLKTLVPGNIEPLKTPDNFIRDELAFFLVCLSRIPKE